MILPFGLVGVISILISRFGVTGLVAIGIVAIMFPIQAIIGCYNGKILEGVNIYKDKRVKVTTEIIEGIKLVKLYGWEIAFRNIIQKLR